MAERRKPVRLANPGTELCHSCHEVWAVVNRLVP